MADTDLPESDQKDEIWSDFFYLELMTGLREGEICGLKWRGLDTEHVLLKIERLVTVGTGGAMGIGETKAEKGKRENRLESFSYGQSSATALINAGSVAVFCFLNRSLNIAVGNK